MLKKLSVLVLTLAVALSMGSTTYAQSISEAELRAAGLTDSEIALFMSLLGGSSDDDAMSSSNRGCDGDYLRDLSMGSTGADVMNLQEFLNDAGFTVSVSGAGSVGMESMYYGAKTAAAVSAMQSAYAADILAPLGLTSGTGYFGASSRDKVRELCAGMPADGGDMDDDDDMDDRDNDDLDGGEASLEDYDFEEGDDDDVEEGQTGEVAEIDFDVEDGDVRVSRLDLTFLADGGNDEDEPWETFDTVTLYDADGDEIAEEDVSDEDDWLDEDSPYVFRFSGLDYVVREGDEAMIMVEVEVAGSVDGADDGETWTIYVADEDIRAIDGEGINQYTGSDATADRATFDVVEEGEDDALELNNSNDDPEAATIEVDDDDESDEYAIFVFDAEVQEDSSDLTLEDVYASITVTNPNGGDDAVAPSDVISRVWLEIEGEEVEGDATDNADDFDANLADTESATVQFLFEFDEDVVLEGDNDDDMEYPVTMIVEFEAQDGAYDLETTVQGSIEAADVAAWEVEGNDDVTAEGTPSGDVHTLALYGVTVAEVDQDFNYVGDETAQGTFTLEFDVTAVGDDLYVDQTAGTAATNGVQYSITGGTPENTSVDIDSTADTVGGEWLIEEDETETFTLTVTINNTLDDAGDDSGTFRVVLDAVQVDDDNDDSGEYDVDVTDEDVETGAHFIGDTNDS